MKKGVLIIMIALMFVCVKVNGQTKQDTVAIKQACMDYIEGYFNKDVDRMLKAIHPELQKRVILKDEKGNCFIQNMGSSMLVQATRGNRNANLLNPDQPFKADITIYEIFENAASVKITNNKYGFMDFAHLGRFNGEWRIINVLWEMYPRPK
jgi:hypothetical protein